ncbi:hypothetical protein B0H13DRAFT_2276193 [Mycena leptocephala]|nr:hypothetical protein B0H13DRAFT_2276193 [Mycena leptocephala]
MRTAWPLLDFYLLGLLCCPFKFLSPCCLVSVSASSGCPAILRGLLPLQFGASRSDARDWLLSIKELPKSAFSIRLPAVPASKSLSTKASQNPDHKQQTSASDSRTESRDGINCGCWMGDPGDDLATSSHPSYGEDAKELLLPLDELDTDPEAPDYTELAYTPSERECWNVH